MGSSQVRQQPRSGTLWQLPKSGRGFGPRYLDVLVQQLLGEALEGDGDVFGEAALTVQQRDFGCVPGERFGVEILERLEVVVDGMADHDLPGEDAQDLKGGEDERGVSDTRQPVPHSVEGFCPAAERCLPPGMWGCPTASGEKLLGAKPWA